MELGFNKWGIDNIKRNEWVFITPLKGPKGYIGWSAQPHWFESIFSFPHPNRYGKNMVYETPELRLKDKKQMIRDIWSII
jgi:hypothetical protein